MRESVIEKEAIAYAKRRGWWEFKVKQANKNGIPDRFLLRNGVSIFIEFKASSGGVLSEQQKIRIAEIEAHGGLVYVINNIEDARRVLI